MVPQSMQPNTGLEIRVGTTEAGGTKVSPNIYVSEVRDLLASYLFLFLLNVLRILGTSKVHLRFHVYIFYGNVNELCL